MSVGYGWSQASGWSVVRVAGVVDTLFSLLCMVPSQPFWQQERVPQYLQIPAGVWLVGAMVAEVDARLLDASVMPNKEGFSGDHGGAFLPPPLVPIMNDITEAYEKIKGDPTFWAELRTLEKHFTGRPSPILHAERLSQKIGGAQIYLKREDLNHTGAHKINHSLGEALLAKRMGKKKLIAETGAGQHGVALATSAALVGLECDIHMGEVDMAKERPNVVRMKILGARVVPATHGLKTLKALQCTVANAAPETAATRCTAKSPKGRGRERQNIH